MTVHLIIKGRVQGVFYRATAKEMALKAGIKGWIRNMPEGHVEAICQGEEHVIRQFIQWCHKGPPGAVVEAVEVTELPEGNFSEFEVRRGNRAL